MPHPSPYNLTPCRSKSLGAAADQLATLRRDLSAPDAPAESSDTAELQRLLKQLEAAAASSVNTESAAAAEEEEEEAAAVASHAAQAACRAATRMLGSGSSKQAAAVAAARGQDSRRSTSTDDLSELEREILAEAEAVLRRQFEAPAPSVPPQRKSSSSRRNKRGGDGSLSTSIELEKLLAEAEDGIAAAAAALGHRSAAVGDSNRRQAGRAARKLAPGGMRTSGGTLDPVFEAVRQHASRAHGNAAAARKARSVRQQLQALANQQQGGSRAAALSGGAAAARPTGGALAHGSSSSSKSHGVVSKSGPHNRVKKAASTLELAGLSPLRGGGGSGGVRERVQRGLRQQVCVCVCVGEGRKGTLFCSV